MLMLHPNIWVTGIPSHLLMMQQPFPANTKEGGAYRKDSNLQNLEVRVWFLSSSSAFVQV